MSWFNIAIQYETDNATQFISSLEGVWKEVSPTQEMNGAFYKEDIQRRFESYKEMFRIFGLLSGLTITMAFMGLIGILIFTTERKKKDISIRKVMGAGTREIFFVYGKTFIILLSVAMVVASIAMFFLINQTLLENIAYTPEFNTIDYLGGILAVSMFSVIFIFIRIKQVAGRNPSDVLRAE